MCRVVVVYCFTDCDYQQSQKTIMTDHKFCNDHAGMYGEAKIVGQLFIRSF